jgi:lipopolysaccharide biosynthesis glycosyltransferase
MNKNTVVSACDHNYIWGAWLLLASMRVHKMKDRALILGGGLTDEDVSLLEQFGDIDVHHMREGNSRSMTCQKPEAMLLADTEYITWADCDAVFTGNVSKYMNAEPHTIRIRKRCREENAMVFSSRYQPGDDYGAIPRKILDIWREDVGENTEPAIDTVCSAAAMTFHRDKKDIIEKWRRQMLKVIPNKDKGVVDQDNYAYFQTDESVLNSVLCFAEGAPEPVKFLLDKNPLAFFAHYTFKPKPWQQWDRYSLRYYEPTLYVVEQAIKEGYRTPPDVPYTFKRKYKAFCAAQAYAKDYTKRIAKMLLRKS